MAKLGLYLLLLFSSHMIASTISQSTTDPDPAASTNEFIESSCQATLYPTLCFQCLSCYATTIQKSPGKLAQAALSVSLDRAQSTSDYVSTMMSVSGLPSREFQAIKGCIATIGDSTSLLNNSIHELDQIGRPTDQDFMLHVSDIQTWVSAALTNLNTCVDGFSSKNTNGDVEAAIKSRVTDATQVTSNALALVNRFVAPHNAPAKGN
ncbi:21 kDa protein-like [Rhododendron vialii]|uniref:21 kDa protein-like n=1 Tax=Rhododendron vialii TaxID=182163 RepID=UPI00265E5C27|nr:21 kDa protein-like [Rhododendron vialii]